MFVLGKHGAASSMCKDYRGIDVVVRQQMLLAPAQPAGGWVPTKPEAERYSTLLRVDTQ
jgi:hypothetical protein